MNKTLTGLAHEIYAAARTAPGEGMEDAAARIEALLAAQQPESINAQDPLTDVAHQVWSAALLAPGEGIEDAARRIEAILVDQFGARVTGQPEPRAFLTDDQRDKIEQAEACLRNTGHKEDREAANGLLDVLIADPVQPEPRDAIERSKRILGLVDSYHENPTQHTRTALRVALMDEFQREPRAETVGGWISVDEKLPPCNRKFGSLGVEVMIWPAMESGERTAFFGRRISQTPCFYRYGAPVHGVTHWMPLPEEPARAEDVNSR